MWTALFSVPLAFAFWVVGIALVMALARRERVNRPAEVHELAVPFAGAAAAFVFAIVGLLFVVAVEIAYLLFFAPPHT